MARGDYGFNATLSAAGFGTRKVRCNMLQQKIGIIANEDGPARTRQAFYSVVVTGSSFSMGMEFYSYAERESFNRWFRRFTEAVLDRTAPNAYMTVRVPSRRFVRTAVPETEIEYGEGLEDLVYTLTIGFVGASDPLNSRVMRDRKLISQYRGPKRRGVSRYFYPAGNQVAGAESLEGTIFDPRPTGSGPAREVEDPADDLVFPYAPTPDHLDPDDNLPDHLT